MEPTNLVALSQSKYHGSRVHGAYEVNESQKSKETRCKQTEEN